MKYKVGDLVKIRTWKEMEREYGIDEHKRIKSKYIFFSEKREKLLNDLSSDRVVEIYKIDRNYYFIKNFIELWKWTDYMIEELAEPINSRFEILDL